MKEGTNQGESEVNKGEDGRLDEVREEGRDEVEWRINR